jgi:hypothetical protein
MIGSARKSIQQNAPLICLISISGSLRIRQSETHPLLSPNDEFANYEIFAILLGDPAGRIPIFDELLEISLQESVSKFPTYFYCTKTAPLLVGWPKLLSLFNAYLTSDFFARRDWCDLKCNK